MTIEAVVAEAVTRIEATHAARERALAASRALVRQCANAIRAVHRAEFEIAEALLREATQTAHGLRDGLVDHSDLLYAGYTQDALKEYAEAALVYAFLHDDPPPGPAALQRTRGDMTAAIRQEQLTAALTALEAKIGSAGGEREG